MPQFYRKYPSGTEKTRKK